MPQERAGLGAGVYKTVNEVGGVFGIVLVGTLLEARIVANALRQVPKHFLPQELSLNAVASLKTLEAHALRKGLAAADLDAFHRALIAAVQRGFDQAFAIAAVLAGHRRGRRTLDAPAAPGARKGTAVRTRPGRPYPLGAIWDGDDVNFALFTEHATAVELCLFEASGPS